MLTMRFVRVLLVLASFLAACGDDDPQPACDAGTLADRLGGAAAGDTVEVGACRIEGSFEVPAGVTLTGAGRDATVLVGSEGQVALTLLPGPGESTTVASDLTVESGGRVGLLAQGEGRFLIERVTVTARRGVAAAVTDARWLVLREVDLEGPVDAELAVTLDQPDPAEVATHGLVVVASPETVLEDVSVRGFALVGALLYGTSGTWTRGEITENLGLGIAQYGGALAVQDVSVTHTLQGVRLEPSFAMVLADGADLDSTGLVVDDNETYGILQAAATARHLDLLARHNGDAAMWIQDVGSLVIQGGSFEENSFAGIVAVDSTGIDVQDLSITGTVLATAVFDGTGRVEVGDGIQLVGSTDGVSLDGVTLSENQRAGVLVDLDGGTGSGISLTGVTVDGTDGQYGVIAQGGTPADGWDEGVTRLGATLANDEAFLEGASTLGLAGTTQVPVTEEDQLRGLIGPNP